MRFAAVLLSCSMLVCASSAVAAMPSAEIWQQQLQKEITALKQKATPLHVDGDVSVETVGDEWIATLPPFHVVVANQAPWEIPGIIMKTSAKGAGKVTITFPSEITQKDTTSRIVSYVRPGQQNVTAQWDFAKGGFKTLNADFKTFNFGDNGSKTTVPHMTVKTTGSNASIVAENASNTMQVVNGALSTSVQSVRINYQLDDNGNLNIGRLIGLVNPTWWLSENVPFSMQTESTKVKFTDRDGLTSFADKLSTRFKIRLNMDGQTAAGNFEVEAQNITQSAKTSYAFLLPKTLRVVGTTSNMPIQTLILGLGQSWPVAQANMANAGTRFEIDQILLETAGKASLKGNGMLKAAQNVPLDFTGRVTLKMQGLEAVVADIQREMLQSGMNGSANAQATILLMALQGIGKKTSTGTEYLLDLTPDGQVLLNGQDFRALLPKPAASPAPATSVNPVN